MSIQRSRRAFLGGIGTATAVGLAGCSGADAGGGDVPGDGDMLIFHAGSLAPPFAAAEPTFEENTGITVTREPKGSVASTKKITQLG
ncbi:MAG: molybdenum ABC transporter substrate-binding protein, partial [Halanaeroarchaeum sp.]